MSDLLWTEVKSFFDAELMDGLPDVHVPDTSIADWQVLLDLIRSSCWSRECREGDAVVDLPSAETVFARPADAELVSVRVWLTPEVLAIFRPWASEGSTIDFDVDLTELQGQKRLDIFCRFMTTIGRELGKPVLMSPEGDWGHPVLGFDPTADRGRLSRCGEADAVLGLDPPGRPHIDQPEAAPGDCKEVGDVLTDSRTSRESQRERLRQDFDDLPGEV